jgi:chemotaxis methyl-accepting protein methylase
VVISELNDFRHIFFTGSDADLPPRAGVRVRGEFPLTRPPRSEGARLARNLDDTASDPDPLVQWLMHKAGVDPWAYRPQPLARRLPACLRHLRTTCPVTAIDLLEREQRLVPTALDALLIGVSEFFRDAAVFSHLEKVVIPELLRTRRSLRICSVGSSGGQELYSMAILLAEAGALEDSYLLGVDCRPEAIKRAAQGVFNSLEGLPIQHRTPYFRQVDDNWVASEHLRRHLNWHQSDLFTWADQSPWDIILFRNVAIYLKDAHASEAWRRLTARLVPDGFFVTGKAEVPPHGLELTRSAASVYRKHP